MSDQQNMSLQMKAKPLTKESIVLLLDMISKHKIILSKSTNATNNKLKEDAWKSIALEFNDVTGNIRSAEQLRLKWENLKKSSRRRISLIRQNNHKTGNWKAFIPPDEVLERVASMLNAACTGLSEEFGGDGVNEENIDEKVIEISEILPLETQMSDDDSVADGSETNFTPKFIYNNPNNGLNNRRKLADEVQKASRDKDLALAAYLQAKTEKVVLENKKIEYSNRKLELKNLKLELEKLKLELEIKLLKQKINSD